jgi:hypothetical protein
MGGQTVTDSLLLEELSWAWSQSFHFVSRLYCWFVKFLVGLLYCQVKFPKYGTLCLLNSLGGWLSCQTCFDKVSLPRE